LGCTSSYIFRHRCYALISPMMSKKILAFRGEANELKVMSMLCVLQRRIPLVRKLLKS
jgi:hypothetical protein